MSGSGGVIAKAFRMVVPQCSELSEARTEKLILPLGATTDKQRPTGHLDRDGLLPTWFHPSPCIDL